MASFFRRKRGLIFKFIVGIPALWFLIVIFTTYQGKLSDSDDEKRQEREIIHRERDIVPPQNNHIHLGDSDKLNHDRKIHAEERQDLDQKIQADKRESEHRRAEKVQAPVVEEKNDDTLRYRKKEPLPERPYVDPNAPGEAGKAVVIDKDKLSPDEKKKFDDGWQRNAFNQYASDMISLHRTLPDVRDPECKDLKYKDNLPDTSVVVCFHNEAWTVLLRTVHSIIDRSPPHLLKEIILVDDFSDMDHLKQPLQDYVAKLRNVKVVRTKKREGLIRARLLGYSVATGEVLTYLDSHCECAEGWLEPLLDRIAENKSIVVCPVIDVIEDDSFKYQYGNARATSIGGFDWNMQFNWHAIPDYERKRRDNKDYLPVRSPTMAGGLFSISREYFTELGTYDPGMDIWGGENLELSFRVWMCGGTLEIIPCSHVGHIFRKRSPYKWRTGVNVVKKNSIRLAEVWMDEYKNYYYERFNYDLGDYGDVTDRKKLRERLQCHSFDWFVKNIYPDLFVPGEAMASGEVRSKAKPMCIDSAVDNHNYHKPVNMWPCHNQGGNQYWMLSKNGEIRRDDGCLDYSGGESVIVYPCHGQKGNQEWQYREDNSIYHANTQKCMEVSVDGQKLTMKTCTGVDRQIWTWKRKSPSGIIRN
ncbi:polypeptide N-acetylgalactosaminyltransferase 5-like isoform X1 [Ostrea edulis]|uniref:polypeptide N-acetylgalactosaminyltransferase 5-like isoform X1 n=1 Tax=Ostrea edulis TaxID=37623 RepID=UPI0024AEAD5E|nr:polypeptide N-acetylgalactosaminyltransferase 5-like isoform X1 [Ostrea edulis]XP_056008171.1 polypeptide N-acetylgalactosaminyltransferase 5-like isoform X1 [Ostrea edulis]XP_056008172.1 polypeptide N-acetylgalactosaminyltransferase 5-like isoform X1 [Ostrea edulis]XP_056008173.1 polypeptide N-acetylgalactosaminyltransferase 5-like isoform X1 [Ostrea edulis]XP_056008178.1 polypeptide N-acetylgalactosaminyltransferase 5-like isoform X1 [Ostrea edulis]XP_056008179.1 polypeptide N-acetylgalac